MNVCLIGDSLISLTLAKALVNKKIKVSVYFEKNIRKINLNRTIGISSHNIDFLKKEVIKINKNLFWGINKIEIYNDKKEKILNFDENKKNLFYILKNHNLYKLLNTSLKKNIFFKKIKIHEKSFYSKIINNDSYDLIINCDPNNEISKKFFYKKILKNYESSAYASVINHKKINNKKALQIFTKYGPLAFLPISNTKTSIVYSIKNKSIKNFVKLSKYEFKKLILKNNQYYKINSINKFETFQLKFKTLRSYYYKNVLGFGETLHQIHPLSGQGFNMTLRDIKVFLRLLNEKKNIGLPINNYIYEEFQNQTKHLNFIFASGNDFIYEFFNYDNIYIKYFSKKLFKYLKNQKYLKKLFIHYANKGIEL
ncbi:ubiquinone biosynthesis protein UbiB [Candidatus Pelagibacter sp.]|nr:ubiquinone biosynthesis protein UbiB [Candidatus Pelagibacter sp.]